MIEFKECATCAAKPGSPTLCDGCLHNRKTIHLLREAVAKVGLYANVLACVAVSALGTDDFELVKRQSGK